tara:strand:+ start:600 stop:1007 length:408 start_codon:yes stop_codon:yes gene_type:complete
MAKRALFIGRWQPFHNGHKWLIDQKLANETPVLIAVRDIPPDVKNPFTTDQTINMIQQVYGNTEQVKVIRIPDIESVNYGRGVGYEINEHVPPQNVGFISATNIRNQIVENSDAWKENVDPSIHGLVKKHLMESV